MGGFRAKSNSLCEISRSPWILCGTPRQSPQCALLVCEKFAENPEFRVGNFAVNLKREISREIKVPHPPPPVWGSITQWGAESSLAHRSAVHDILTDLHTHRPAVHPIHTDVLCAPDTGPFDAALVPHRTPNGTAGASSAPHARDTVSHVLSGPVQQFQVFVAGTPQCHASEVRASAA